MQFLSDVATSADGVPVHFDVHGDGAVALVFVHGWRGDRRVWRQQLHFFAPRFRVVRLDLAGHGASGWDRPRFTIPAFAADVVAVVERIRADQVVLIGHSMSGFVVVEAARHLPSSVIGLVGVDTLWDVEQERTAEQVAEIMAPFRADFAETARRLAQSMFTPSSDRDLADAIVADLSSETRKEVAIDALEATMSSSRSLRLGLDEIRAPVTLINSSHWRPTNREAAARRGIDLATMSGVGHFVMLEDPGSFNRLLHDAVQGFLRASARR